MELYFLRHADAAGQVSSDTKTDSARPLTPRGIQDAKEAAKGMKNLGLSFDHVVSSPYLRAVQTAEIIAEAFLSGSKIELADTLVPHGDFKNFSKLLGKFEGDESVLFVGHQPALGTFISELVFGKSRASIDLKKCGLCHIQTSELGPGDLAEFEWLLTPEQLKGHA